MSTSRQSPDVRPHPDELLRRIEAGEAAAARGRLKVFLGYASRVGKSERMFDEGRRRKSRGQDVVIGAVQAKGSEELSEFIREFEVIPLREGAVDVERILARHPEVCLIDELARRNAPRSPRPYRWQDVQQLLNAGINVVTAINLQHIFEQQDAVARLTGKRADDSIPQSFLESANEIVIVDAPAGRSPVDDDLREMALLLAAQVVEDHLQRYLDDHGIHQSWGTQERILVCITPRSNAKAMLESAARNTARFHGHMFALWVKQKDLTREQLEAVEEHLALAHRLGAEVHSVDAPDPIRAILEFAQEHRVTQIFLGHTQQPVWKFWKTSSVDRIIREAEGMDIRLFPQAWLA
jgi:two-component system, OmpR family, sensor histidine kinase KdpD